MDKRIKAEARKNPNIRPLTREVAGYWGMVGASENYFSAFAVALKASEFQIALLNSIPQLLGGVSQLIGLHFITRGLNRLKIVILGCYAQIATLLALGVIPFLPIQQKHMIGIMLALVTSYFVALNAHVPAWYSLYRDLIPENIRARFSGYRSQGGLIALFVVYSLAGIILDYSDRLGSVFIGYLVIFIFAAIARGFSTHYNSQLQCPEFSQSTDSKFSFRQFLRRMPRSRFGHFVIFSSLMNMSIVLGSVFITMYLLRGLNMSYFDYMLVTTAASLTQFGTVARWGAMIERHGNLSILHLTSVLLCLIPLCLLVSTNLIWLTLVFILIGITVAGYNLACFNYIFITVAADKIPRCSAYQNIIQGLLHLVGALAGAALFKFGDSTQFNNLLDNDLTPYALVFLVSGILRILSTLLFFKLSRPRRNEHISKTNELLNQPH
jgi:hypothetical protein